MSRKKLLVIAIGAALISLGLMAGFFVFAIGLSKHSLDQTFADIEAETKFFSCIGSDGSPTTSDPAQCVEFLGWDPQNLNAQSGPAFDEFDPDTDAFPGLPLITTPMPKAYSARLLIGRQKLEIATLQRPDAAAKEAAAQELVALSQELTAKGYQTPEVFQTLAFFSAHEYALQTLEHAHFYDFQLALSAALQTGNTKNWALLANFPLHPSAEQILIVAALCLADEKDAAFERLQFVQSSPEITISGINIAVTVAEACGFKSGPATAERHLQRLFQLLDKQDDLPFEDIEPLLADTKTFSAVPALARHIADGQFSFENLQKTNSYLSSYREYTCTDLNQTLPLGIATPDLFVQAADLLTSTNAPKDVDHAQRQLLMSALRLEAARQHLYLSQNEQAKAQLTSLQELDDPSFKRCLAITLIHAEEWERLATFDEIPPSPHALGVDPAIEVLILLHQGLHDEAYAQVQRAWDETLAQLRAQATPENPGRYQADRALPHIAWLWVAVALSAGPTDGQYPRLQNIPDPITERYTAPVELLAKMEQNDQAKGLPFEDIPTSVGGGTQIGLTTLAGLTGDDRLEEVLKLRPIPTAVPDPAWNYADFRRRAAHARGDSAAAKYWEEESRKLRQFASDPKQSWLLSLLPLVPTGFHLHMNK